MSIIKVVGGKGPKVLTYRGKFVSNADAAAYNFNSLSIGDAPTGLNTRHVIVAFDHSGSGVAVDHVDFESVNATLLAQIDDPANASCYMYGLEVATGTDFDLHIDLDGTSFHCHGAYWTIDNLNSLTPHDTQTKYEYPYSGETIDIPGNGILLAYCTDFAQGSGDWTWGGDITDGNEHFDEEGATSVQHTAYSESGMEADETFDLDLDAANVVNTYLLAASFS